MDTPTNGAAVFEPLNLPLGLEAFGEQDTAEAADVDALMAACAERGIHVQIHGWSGNWTVIVQRQAERRMASGYTKLDTVNDALYQLGVMDEMEQERGMLGLERGGPAPIRASSSQESGTIGQGEVHDSERA